MTPADSSTTVPSTSPKGTLGLVALPKLLTSELNLERSSPRLLIENRDLVLGIV